MKITIISLGTPHLPFAKAGIGEYMKRLQRFAKVDLVHVKEDKKANAKILDLVAKKFVVLLDEKGKSFSSQSLSDFLHKQKQSSRDVCFIIGGADGHTQEIRERGDFLWSLSDLTFPHDIALMLLTETLYRSLTIGAGHPYHRV